MNYKIFPNKNLAANELATELHVLFSSLNKEKITIAISGGTTPFILFDSWATHYKTKIDWNKIHFFWVDERCVLPTSDESNFGNTKKVLFDNIDIPKENIHRIKGDNNPTLEAERYAQEIEQHVTLVEGIPTFDIMLLGMGDDGHTASIFPHQIELMKSSSIVSVAQNPYSKQNRITLTGKVINNAVHVFFLVTGKSKAKIVKQIFAKEEGYSKYPAALINNEGGELTWILDSEAALFI